MDIFNWLKMDSFESSFQLWENKSHTGQDLVNKKRVLAFLPTSNFNSDSLGPFWHTLFSCSNFLLKFVSPFLCPYSTPPLLLWCPNDDLFPQKSSPFPHFYQFSSLPDGQVVRHLPDPLILLKTSCHSDTRALDKVFSPHASRNKMNVLMFFSFARNLMLTRCSIPLSSMTATN